jgi:hypothetical protein
VAKSSTGKLVSQIGASGGGKAYKKARPGNYYGVLFVIVILGLTSVVFSRYEYQNPNAAPTGPAPQPGTTWFAALNIDNCGTQITLPSDTSYKGGFVVLANNVIKVAPVGAADSGNNATVGQFANEYVGMTASSSTLAIPGPTGIAQPSTTFRNNTGCAAGTKYAGQTATIRYAYWSTLAQTSPKITTDPSSIKFTPDMRITMAFLPAAVKIAPPSQGTISAMFTDAAAAAAATTTTTLAGTVTTNPVVTTTTLPATTTTTAAG